MTMTVTMTIIMTIMMMMMLSTIECVASFEFAISFFLLSRMHFKWDVEFNSVVALFFPFLKLRKKFKVNKVKKSITFSFAGIHKRHRARGVQKRAVKNG